LPQAGYNALLLWCDVSCSHARDSAASYCCTRAAEILPLLIEQRPQLGRLRGFAERSE
jgi:hypothetical protein